MEENIKITKSDKKIKKITLIDGHIDTLMALAHQNRKFSEKSSVGSCDLHRMRVGNIQAALFAIYPAATKKDIILGLDNWFKLINNPKNEIIHIKQFDDFNKAQKQNKIGAVLHFEGCGGIDKELSILRLSHKLGLRTLGITHIDRNKFATGTVFSGSQSERGLTDKGKKLIHEAQRLGITIDVSHLNDPSFWDVFNTTEKPIFASHSNSRAITPHMRNLTDKQIKAIQEIHGTIGINFGVAFLDPKNEGSKNVDLGIEIFKKHIDHIVDVSDINTVAIGTDFDGTTLPKCMNNYTQLPKLWEYLLNNGYSSADLKKISHENLLRVFKNTWSN